ncbi:hypothetical protein [Limosilactobacillus sp.]|jgi:hypothetical protein|uniref:hypothetical protein n=1 Tax=Limosilactobacillus sp. TaxID=2773925 RepID=UPI0035A0CF0C
MTDKDLLQIMQADDVEVDPEEDGETVYDFKINQHPFGHLDKYGNLYLDNYDEVISRPLSMGKQWISHWVAWAARGFRMNLRRLGKWQSA